MDYVWKEIFWPSTLWKILRNLIKQNKYRRLRVSKMCQFHSDNYFKAELIFLVKTYINIYLILRFPQNACIWVFPEISANTSWKVPRSSWSTNGLVSCFSITLPRIGFKCDLSLLLFGVFVSYEPELHESSNELTSSWYSSENLEQYILSNLF